ncbi:MAG: alkaline phosphatase [Paraprevotella sp.]|nr:alkaline phosphatase [Paraprevotella sp.]
MKKRIFSTCIMVLFALMAWAGQMPKYIFYFIGDGMGVNQVNGTETYLAALEGRIGTTPLCFAQFPITGLGTTYSATNGVTDSAASGTALASGTKTKNGAIGVQADGTTALESVAVKAQKKGYAVGITTSVSVDHATPAAFYAHTSSRNNYYKIGQDLIETNFDFYAGSDFLQPTHKDAVNEGSLYEQCEKAGYTIARGYKDYQKKAAKAEKIVLLQPESASKKDRSALPYAIDRGKKDMSLAEITRAGIHFLTQQKKEGFFLMIEGGKIDWACHANDGATVFKEVIDLDEAVKVAYEFYAQHPDETLIVVTADHETGGLALGTGAYAMNTEVLKYQQQSVAEYGKTLGELRKKHGKELSWTHIEQSLKENFGFWTNVKLNDHQTNRLKKAFDNIVKGIAQNSESMYQKDDELATTAKQILNEIALIGWQSGGHSNGYVPVFAIGAGAETFSGRIDNTDIPKKIAQAAGF